MATATATVLGTATLTGTTPTPDSAPTTYTLRTAAGSYTLSSLATSSTLAIDSTRTKLTFTSGDTLIIPTAQLSSFINGLAGAKVEVDAKLKQAATTAPVTTPTTTTPVQNSKPATTSAPNSTATPPPITNTGEATVDAPTDKPQSVYAFGDEIDDIYDPNLTPEQVASLSPGDQKARAAYLADNENFQGPPEEIVVTAPYAEGSAKGLSNSTFIAESTATAQDFAQFQAKEDWRVRLTLANDAEYLYRAQEPGILAPLATTDGVVFPYTPIIAVNYAANYEQTTITHSNYKIFQYSNSSVDSINITCDFTAQDTHEANYLLAVIHFFRTMTKMFYGQDEFPKNGTPPPLCYMFGLGGFQFEAHPLAITNFSYNLPNDVDYIRTTTTITSTARYGEAVIGNNRLPPEVRPGGTAAPANFDSDGEGFSPTYVPTKIQLAITCVPIMSRNAISNRFSLRDYATGKLLQGSTNLGGGIW